MKGIKHPATMIAALALFLALGGGAAAYASGLIPGSQISNNSIAAKMLTKSAISALKAHSEQAGPTTSWDSTPPCAARACAYVLPGTSPTLDPARTKNFKAVINNGTGIYCLTPSWPLTEAGSTPIVTVEWGESSGSNLSAYWREHPLGNSCPKTTQFEVQTYTFTAGGNNTLSNNVAFTIVVP